MIPVTKITLAIPGIVDALQPVGKVVSGNENQQANQDKLFQDLLIKSELENLARTNPVLDIQDEFIHENRTLPDLYLNLQGKALPHPFNFQPSVLQDYQENGNQDHPDRKPADQTLDPEDEPPNPAASDHADQFDVYIQMANAGQIQTPLRSEAKDFADDDTEQSEQNERKYNWLPLALISVIAVLLLLILLH